MWGSNFPATHDRSIKPQLVMARDELSFLPEEDQCWLFGETALKLWPTLRETRNYRGVSKTPSPLLPKRRSVRSTLPAGP